jgi:sterol desaturase/sphingolipid hydroxylase (fatty acid hydroxylase superfamily)
MLEIYSALILAIYQYLSFIIPYYFFSFLCFMADYNSWFSKHKIQEKANYDVAQLYKKVLPTVIINTLIPLPFLFVFSLLGLINIGGYALTVHKVIFDVIGCIALTDMLFYTAHRIFHTAYLYKNYHKKHHEINMPIGVSALYMTKMDLIFGNLLPSYLPIILVSAHPVSACLWLGLASSNTVIMAHSGFKWLADFHDYHHVNPKKNYGANIFMDRLFKTDQQVHL